MNHKPLILLFIFFIITYLLIRKEKYENEEEIGEVEVPPGLNISDFLRKLEIMKEENKKNEETLDALYDVNSDTNQDSQEQASEAIQDENETQYAFLKDFVDGAQQTEQEIRDDARTQVNAQLEDIVTNQARDYFAAKDTGFGDIPKKKGIVKVDNSSFDSLSAGLAAATDITTYGGVNVYGDGSQFYTAIVPRCHKRPQLVSPAVNSERMNQLSQEEYSCLNEWGAPDKVGEDGFVVDSFEQCATKCLESDKCSGFSVVPDSNTFPDEGFGLTCKLTHHEFEDSKEVPASKNEQVFAVHENDYLKNPLYIHMFSDQKNQTVDGYYTSRFGSDNHTGGSQCKWRSSCGYYPYCSVGKVFPDYQNGSGALPGFYGFGGPTCKDGVKIENDTSKPAKIFKPPSSGEDPAPDPPPEYEPCDGKYCGDTFLVPAPEKKCHPLVITDIDPDGVFGWTYPLEMDVRESVCIGLNETRCKNKGASWTPNGPMCEWSAIRDDRTYLACRNHDRFCDPVNRPW